MVCTYVFRNLCIISPLCVLRTGSITLSPSFGSGLGGTGVLVSGTQLSFKEDDRISCVFDDMNVTGVYVTEQQALCVSPPLAETGRLLFQITIDNSVGSVSGESTFTSCKKFMFTNYSRMCDDLFSFSVIRESL